MANYDALKAANKNNEITEWLAWFAGICLEAQRRTESHIEFLLNKARLLERVRGQLNERQLTVLLREGPEGFTGGLSAGKYVSIAKVSAATATRDLAETVERGVFLRTGEKKHTRYWLTIPLRPVPRIVIGTGGEIVEVGKSAGPLG